MPIYFPLEITETLIKLHSEQNQTILLFYLEFFKFMKRIILISILFTFIILAPIYSGCWKMDHYKILYTGGIGASSWGGTAAYGDSILYYLEHPVLGDTVIHWNRPGSLLWRTTNATDTFELLASSVRNNPVYEADSINDGCGGCLLDYMRKIVMHDEKRIYIAGYATRLLYSDDAAKTWKVKIVMPKKPGHSGWRVLNDFATHPGGLGVICYEKKEDTPDYKLLLDSIILTTDNWETTNWVDVTNGDSTVYIRKACIADSNTIYLVGWLSRFHIDGLIKSSDRGKTWTHIPFNKERIGLDGLSPGVAFFINQDTGWVAGFQYGAGGDIRIGNNIIFKTEDGGITWRQQLSDNTGSVLGIKQIEFANDSIGFALAEVGGYEASGKVTDIVTYRTTDGGEHWTRIMPDSSGLRHDMAVNIAVGSANTAYMVAGWWLYKYDTECGTTGVEERMPPAPEEFKIYPNPLGSNRTAKIQLGNTYGESLTGVYLYDSRGANVSSHISYSLFESEELEFRLAPELSRGTYIVTVLYGVNRIKYCKIVVE